MRILMLNNEFPPLGGGTGTVNRAILQRLSSDSELQIDLITSALGRRSEQEPFAERTRIFKVPVENRNIHHSSNRELLTYAARALWLALRLQRAQPYDLCFAWSAVPAGWVALMMHKLARLRYLVRVCGPDIPGFEERYGPLYPAMTPIIKAIWRGAETVVAKCQGEVDMIRTIDAKAHITLIPNGVDLTMFRPGCPIPDAGPLRLLCVGRLIARKGQNHLLEAVKRLVDAGLEVELDLIGDGDAMPAYKLQANQLGIEPRVIFSGYVPREQMPARYAAAHIFVLPSYNEGMSVATLEALAAGLPVVITRTGGAAELVTEGENGLVFDWADIARLTAHLRHLAFNRDLARQMGAAARIHAERFGWENVVRQYQDLFMLLSRREA